MAHSVARARAVTGRRGRRIRPDHRRRHGELHRIHRGLLLNHQVGRVRRLISTSSFTTTGQAPHGRTRAEPGQIVGVRTHVQPSVRRRARLRQVRIEYARVCGEAELAAGPASFPAIGARRRARLRVHGSVSVVGRALSMHDVVPAGGPGVGRRDGLRSLGTPAHPQADVQTGMDHPRRRHGSRWRIAVGGMPTRGLRGDRAHRLAGASRCR